MIQSKIKKKPWHNTAPDVASKSNSIQSSLYTKVLLQTLQRFSCVWPVSSRSLWSGALRTTVFREANTEP